MVEKRLLARRSQPSQRPLHTQQDTWERLGSRGALGLE